MDDSYQSAELRAASALGFGIRRSMDIKVKQSVEYFFKFCDNFQKTISPCKGLQRSCDIFVIITINMQYKSCVAAVFMNTFSQFEWTKLMYFGHAYNFHYISV